MKSALIVAAVFALCLAAVPARADLFACVGASGKKIFTTSPEDPACKRHPSYEPGAKKSAPAPKPALAPAPKPAPVAIPAKKKIAPAPKPAAPRKINIPKVTPKTQADRDILRRQILIHELNREIKTRETLLKNIAQAKSQVIRTHFKRLVRVHELNILAIRREIDLLGGNSARN